MEIKLSTPRIKLNYSYLIKTDKESNATTDYVNDKQRIVKRRVVQTEYHPWQHQHRNNMCSTTKSHHTTIPQREKGFRFHRFHGHTYSVKDCKKRCCNKDECILSFHIASTCYGVICNDEARSCHSVNDQLHQMKIYFTSFKGINLCSY